ncbi:LOW QUALITY PROTEIN: pentatricopeptide repeat-containing protein At2g01510, mitochondrial-like [Elaeis guineensis]|uniref:LOW QUALITY PROTEIN: pentatricopeptide repeat-containing protein At2g01510, mitochondrial-like n=1 Tax=Elaeis guineensis var. tenera TaxID=51953 RepID=A0A6I9SMH9_ELAGV|nr:LOW QUALITY PROTEIN: pentatricopeptide repeat-containing protein At2g01510, mitochondrial-like [Elaeis guineensis]
MHGCYRLLFHSSRLHLPENQPTLFVFPFRSCSVLSPKTFDRKISTNSSLVSAFYDLHLRSCNNLYSLEQIHSNLATTGLLQHSPHLSAQIIVNYSKFGLLDRARALFDAVHANRSFLWNTIIRVYATSGHVDEALHLYSFMRPTGIPPNNYTFPFVLKACASKPMLRLRRGRGLHCEALKTGFDLDIFVQAALVDMYAKCGEIDDGCQVFDGMLEKDIVSWTTMITAYEQSTHPQESLLLFRQMQAQGIGGDQVTAISVASAIAQLGDIKTARSLHTHVIRNGFRGHVEVGNSLIAMYSNCGDVKSARLVFDGMKERDDISWNSMISGYSQNGNASDALLLFEQMRVHGPESNMVTALALISVCSHLGSLHLAKQVHSLIVSWKVDINTLLWNSLADMYAKCGDMDSAVQMFHDNRTSTKDASSWNVMISAYGLHGHGREALKLYQQMRAQGIQPDDITFTSLLSACSHAGLVEEGREVFDSMKELTMLPMAKHYACMVDLLGRAGLLDEAFDLIAEMPSEPNDAVWGALLGACRIHGNMKLGELAAKRLLCLEPEHTGYHVLMSNVYAASTRWHEVGKVREAMRDRGLKKPAAFSVLEFGREVHGFHTADQFHPEHVKIYGKIEGLIAEMKMKGYVPDGSCVLHDVEEEDKEHILKLHSEKLAVAYGIMRLQDGLPIRITKNLRICNDCHVAFKFISQVCNRMIIMRDANRFHHFQDGSCSCKDYW